MSEQDSKTVRKDNWLGYCLGCFHCSFKELVHKQDSKTVKSIKKVYRGIWLRLPPRLLLGEVSKTAVLLSYCLGTPNPLGAL
jgi:hypothetical protein